VKSRSAAFTTAMIAVCWLVFVLDFLSPKTQGVGQITFRLGLFPNDVLRGEWWRLITYGFVHPAWYYILANSIALFQAGDFVEYVYSSRRYMLIYLASLVGAGLAAYMTTVGTHVLTVGASGAVMGVLGAMAVLAFKLPPLRNELWRVAVVPVLIILAIGVSEQIGFLRYGLSIAGLIGGFVSGVIAASLINPVHGREIIRQIGPARIPADRLDPGSETAWDPPRRG
jgi:rhomboid protease GluP